jgi:hypothetical protein
MTRQERLAAALALELVINAVEHRPVDSSGAANR